MSVGAWVAGGRAGAWRDRGGLVRGAGLRSGCRERGGALVGAGWSRGPGLRTISLPSVQYNKFTAAGAQQLAASLRKCPHVETLA